MSDPLEWTLEPSDGGWCIVDEYGEVIEALGDDYKEAKRMLDEIMADEIEAREQGRCTCRMEAVNSASIDPPGIILDPWCPEHGSRDPDHERQKRIDDAIDFPFADNH